MSKKSLIDLTGRTFGYLKVIRRKKRHNKRPKTRSRIYWSCVCRCGKKHVVSGCNLVSGAVRSCGCLRREISAKINLTHGHALSGKHSPTYRSYAHMLTRCLNNKNDRYRFYGARGVGVCDRWRGRDGFVNFLLDLGPRPPGTTLGRFGDIGDYSPSNAMWMNHSQQLNQARIKRLLLTSADPGLTEVPKKQLIKSNPFVRKTTAA